MIQHKIAVVGTDRASRETLQALSDYLINHPEYEVTQVATPSNLPEYGATMKNVTEVFPPSCADPARDFYAYGGVNNTIPYDPPKEDNTPIPPKGRKPPRGFNHHKFSQKGRRR